ncbi:MAG: hypothetical protein HS102_00465 [Planctomycetia bacterium]|nr:hypothetical protein [Planctomycetia bacterium]
MWSLLMTSMPKDAAESAVMICGCAPFADALNAVLRFESSGNLVEDDRHRYQYDAWNRLVLVQRIAADGNGTDAATLHAAEYDGLGRRIEKAVSNCGDLDGTFRFWYNGQQVIEVRDGSSNVLTQAYYGTQYIDELVALKLEHGYALVSQDANYNVTTLTDLGGRVLERVFYTEYGQPILESERYFGDYDADGDVDATDDGFLGSGQTCWGTPTGACRVFDFNSDGTLNSSDETIMTALAAAASTNRRHENRTVSPTGMAFLHQGLLFDTGCAAQYNRLRSHSSSLQRFHQRDPLEYVDSFNLYTSLANNPITRVDSFGENAVCSHCCRRDNDCANVCRNSENDGTSNGDDGWVMCCCGRKISCTSRRIREGDSCIANCTKVHEKAHKPHVNCDNCGVERPPFKDGIHEHYGECVAYRASAKCLFDAYNNCPENGCDCNAVIAAAQRHRARANWECRIAKIPIGNP